MTDDTRDRMADLREDLDREAQRYEKARDHIEATTASDASGRVRMTIDPQGNITSLVVDRSWRDHVEVEDLAGAVMEAYAAVGAERVRLWSEDLAEADDVPGATRPTPDQSSSIAAQLQDITEHRQDSVDAETTLSALIEMVDEVDQGLDEAFERADTQLSREVHGQSPRPGRPGLGWSDSANSAVSTSTNGGSSAPTPPTSDARRYRRSMMPVVALRPPPQMNCSRGACSTACSGWRTIPRHSPTVYGCAADHSRSRAQNQKRSMSFKTAMKALSSDATRWDDTSNMLEHGSSAATESSGAATALRKVKDTYQGDDDKARDAMQSKWQWL